MGVDSPDEGALSLVDCTLREGEQTAGVWFTVEEKLSLVDALAASGVRWLDAGMPAVSDDERRFLRLATGRTEARIGASVRATVAEVELAISTGCDELFVICPTSEMHRRDRLGLSEDEMLTRIEAVVTATRRGGRICNLVAEDASRTSDDELLRALLVAADAGCDRLFLCDTVGAWTPSTSKAAVRLVRDAVPGLPLGVHCHNDFGLATANTLVAIEAGCSWPTATVNGVGERAGNASLLEIAAACERLLDKRTHVDLAALGAISREVERLTGFVVPQHQPLVGFNAFRHESGIHVDGLLKSAQNYEVVAPSLVGQEHRYVVGKHSGRALLRRFAANNGWPDDDETLARVLERIKNRRPDWARESFARVRQAIDRYNATCLGVPESQLDEVFREVTSDGAAEGQPHYSGPITSRKRRGG